MHLTLLGSTFRIHPVVGGGPGSPSADIGLYLSRLWPNFQNSFVWWKLVKILIDFYSISDFLAFIVWPLEVAEVTKVSRVNFFQQKIQNFQFLARNTWYTSNESWDYVEFKFTTKKYDLIEKNDKKSHFCLENEADHLFSRANFSIFYKKNFKSGFTRGWQKLQLEKSPKKSFVSLVIRNWQEIKYVNVSQSNDNKLQLWHCIADLALKIAAL